MFFLMVLAIFVVFALFIKLSAKVWAITVPWKHAFIYPLIVFAITLFVHFSIIGLLSGALLPKYVIYPLGLTGHLAFGSWYFSKRGTTKEGAPIGWRGGVKISGLTYGLWILTRIVLFGVELHAKYIAL